jgi:hypothetical protein
MTDSKGEFQFFYVAGFMPGMVTVQVLEPSTGLVAAQDLLLVEAGPARVALFHTDPRNGLQKREGALLPADGAAELPVLAEITDLAGIPLAGVELRIEVLDSSNGWIELLDAVSDAQGQVQFVYHAGSHTGSVRLRAYISAGLTAVSAIGTTAPLIPR